MAKQGYTWWPKDWNNSESVFELNLLERGLFRELIDLAMQNDNKTKVNLPVWSRKWGASETDLISIMDRLSSLGLIEITSEMLFIPSCENRLNLARGGAKGGKNKPTPKPTGKPTPKPTLKQTTTTTETTTETERIIDIGDTSKKHFIIVNSPYANEPKYRLYGVDGVGQFLEMNGSKWPRIDHAEKFLWKKDGRPFDSFGHILDAYGKYIENQYK